MVKIQIKSLRCSSEEIMDKQLLQRLHATVPVCQWFINLYLTSACNLPVERFVSAAYHIGTEHVESCGTRKLSDFPHGRKIPVSG